MNHRISFCTVCMNRLHHLRHTLPKNIEDNISYPNIEFIVMDYSSTDGLEDWMKKEMAAYIDKGILTYYRYTIADYFDRGHSRNMMFKLASGEILCNVDADNYIGENFAVYVNSVFTAENDIFLIPDTKMQYYYIRDAFGRLCTRKTDFISIRGYDEKMKGYGFEDNDLYDRLSHLGKRESVIKDIRYLNAIKHENNDRIANEFFTHYLDSLYIHYESLTRSNVVILFKNGSFHMGAIIPDADNGQAPALLENLLWTSGTWKKEDQQIILNSSTGKDVLIDHKTFLVHNNCTFFKIENEPFRERIPYELPFITNYSYFLYNKRNRLPVNDNGFGQGSVHKNFSTLAIDVN